MVAAVITAAAVTTVVAVIMAIGIVMTVIAGIISTGAGGGTDLLVGG